MGGLSFSYPWLDVGFVSFDVDSDSIRRRLMFSAVEFDGRVIATDLSARHSPVTCEFISFQRKAADE